MFVSSTVCVCVCLSVVNEERSLPGPNSINTKIRLRMQVETRNSRVFSLINFVRDDGKTFFETRSMNKAYLKILIF